MLIQEMMQSDLEDEDLEDVYEGGVYAGVAGLGVEYEGVEYEGVAYDEEAWEILTLAWGFELYEDTETWLLTIAGLVTAAGDCELDSLYSIRYSG